MEKIDRAEKVECRAETVSVETRRRWRLCWQKGREG